MKADIPFGNMENKTKQSKTEHLKSKQKQTRVWDLRTPFCVAGASGIVTSGLLKHHHHHHLLLKEKFIDNFSTWHYAWKKYTREMECWVPPWGISSLVGETKPRIRSDQTTHTASDLFSNHHGLICHSNLSSALSISLYEADWWYPVRAPNMVSQHSQVIHSSGVS